MRAIINFLVYSNLFIACCALAFTYESFLLLHLPSSLNWYLLLIFLCTVFIYNLHYYVKLKKNRTDDRLQWCRQNKKLVLWLIIASLFFIGGGIVYHFKAIFGTAEYFNYNNLIWFIILPILALGYSYPFIPWNRKSLRQIGWLKMTSLSFIWSFTTVALPVYMLPGNRGLYAENLSILLLLFQRFIFVAAVSFLFNIKDYEEDRMDGIKTLVVILGPQKSLQYGKWIMPIVNTVITSLLLWYFDLKNLACYAASLIPIILLFFLYQYYSPMKSTAFFVVRNDGLMLTKALLLIFALLLIH